MIDTFRTFCMTAVVFKVFPWNFAREIGARPAKIDPFTHAQRMPDVFWAPESLSTNLCPSKRMANFDWLTVCLKLVCIYFL